MKKVGITANQGSGKTFVINEFSKIGIPTLIMDNVVKDLQTNNKEVIKKLSDRFPEGFPNGLLDKFKMREILFNDLSGKNKLDISIIIQPYLMNEINLFFEKNKDKDYVLVESALIFEYSMDKIFDDIIFIDSDPTIRKEKAMLRDNITSKEYDLRMKDQMSDDDKRVKCKYLIFNDFTNNVIDEVFKTNNKIKKNI